MKSATAPLIAHLASGRQFVPADLYTITLNNGTTLRYTSYDATLGDGLNTWLAGGPVIERGRTRCVIGLEVDTLDLRIWPKDDDLLAGLSWYQAANAGVLDSALVRLDRAFLDVTSVIGKISIIGKISMFVGRVAPITIGFPLEITVNSLIESLSIQMPVNLYQAGCQHTVFNPGCALARAAYAVNGSVSGAPTLTSFATALGQFPGYFDIGSLQFTSGPNSGLMRTVKRWDGLTLTLLNPLPALPVAGNSFTVWPGCDRTKATCVTRFNNVIHFMGMPHVPVPETAL